MKNILRSIPNAITLLNLFAGILAVAMAMENNLGYAGLLILLASVFDFLDGFAARLLKAYSDTGKELDSLADVVSFGVAPGMIAFILMKKAMPGSYLPLTDLSLSLIQWIMLLSPFLIPLFSALRLAKFNIDTRQSINFLGMPTPANAILWASFGILSQFSEKPEIPLLLFNPVNLLITTIVTSLLLVSELPMFSLKFKNYSFSSNWYRYFFLLASILLFVFLGIYGLPVVILLYLAMSISFYLFKIDL